MDGTFLEDNGYYIIRHSYQSYLKIIFWVVSWAQLVVVTDMQLFSVILGSWVLLASYGIGTLLPTWQIKINSRNINV